MTPTAGESGQVTAFVAGVAAALLLAAGLVIDGGALLNAKRQALDDAEQAARAAAQGLDVQQIRAGGAHRLDASAAAAHARRYLAGIGRTGTVAVRADRVTVTVTVPVRLSILTLAGHREVTVTGTAAAGNLRSPAVVSPSAPVGPQTGSPPP